MKILGISAYYHDSAAAIVVDGRIIAAAQEERFTRKKHDPSFPTEAVRYCLEEAGLNIDDLDAVVFYDKPLIKFERLLETYYAFSPKGIASFAKAIPVWVKEKLLLKKLIRDELKNIQPYNKKELKLLFPEHHLSHAASAFYPSPFQEAAILTVDGVGEWSTASICHGNGAAIELKKELRFPHSVGLLYSAFTYFLGFRVNSGEYKLMGLAPYGDPSSERVRTFEDKIRNQLIAIYEDGSIWLDQRYFNYAAGLRMVKDKKWESLFGFPRRKAESDLEQIHCDLGLAIQNVTEEIVLKLAAHAVEITGSKNLCLAGGVALNCVANGKLQKSGIVDELYIQPAAGDAGGALGGALAAHYLREGTERTADGDQMKGSYFGPSYDDKRTQRDLNKYNAVSTTYDSDDELCALVAKEISEGSVVGWFQGRMEFGPRALGNRSIIGDPTSAENQKKLNLKIKYRESFRPFAPSVAAESVSKYFDTAEPSPYMLLVHPVQESLRNPLPADYHSLPLKEKLYHSRSKLPAITHIDMSSRIQTVSPDTNPIYHKLILEFGKLTGFDVLINTSFNVRGEPIVCTPDDAYRCFMRTEMDILVINNRVFRKTEQPDWQEKDNWQEEYVLD